ncbi:hypothetical protein CCACVL1_16033 [Corchorus capsularis]|uniref:Uncharacterized protein n=1 Tax=Corchorus capsularis TaxID=210143 RepID=A0A1R3HZP6_COCAP|nr:hypothetical protein CCACVL1_16033 [Corchorus capsularis]
MEKDEGLKTLECLKGRLFAEYKLQSLQKTMQN